jgi:cytochrome P450
MLRECPVRPPDAYFGFQADGTPHKVKLWDGNEVWIFTRYDDVRAILADTRFSVMPTRPKFPTVTKARQLLVEAETTFIRLDPPEHRYYRRMLTKEFMVAHIETLRPLIRQQINDLIDKMLAKGPPLDFIEELCFPLPSLIISHMMGVPYEQHEFFQEQARYKVSLGSIDPRLPLEAAKKLRAYLGDLIRQKEAMADSGEDMISRLIVEQIRPGHLSHDAAAHMMDLILTAGHETTANQIALGMFSFLTNPEQKRKLEADPDLVNAAVEEMLRLHSIVQYNGSRVALEDIEVRGHIIRKGEGVIALINAANRDPAVFECPHDFNIERPRQLHMAFSFGIHQCLGQPLARIELQEVFRTIFQRMPNISLAIPEHDIAFNEENSVVGIQKFPIRW